MARMHAAREPDASAGDRTGIAGLRATARRSLPGGPSAMVKPATSPAIAQLQRAAGNRATVAFLQRLVEDESAPYGGSGGTGGGGLELPPPGAAFGGEAIAEAATAAGEAIATAESAGASMATAAAGEAALEALNTAFQSAGGGPGGQAAATGHRTLRRGSRGDDVGDLQGRLNAAGSADPALVTDGIFGRLTQAAVREYQASHGLSADGVVGPLTWASLDPGGGGGGGGGAGPTPVTDPLAGIVTIAGHGASAAAVAQARTQAIEEYGSIAPANRHRMEADPITIDVIPHDKKLTELPEYAHLAGTMTFDGRLWDNVRGIQTEVNGIRRVAVAEEDLVTVAGTPASYGSGFLEAHEGGHGLQFSGLTAAQQATLQTIYTARLAASGPITQSTPAGAATAMWLNPAWYSAANKEEYFADSVAAYHGHPYTNGAADVAMYTPGWLQTNDPPMYQLLQQVYQHGANP